MLRPYGKLPRLGHPGSGEANTDTVQLIPPEAAPGAAGEAGGGPVFVDTSGRRGKRMRRLAYTAGALCAAYAGVLVLSLLGATPFAPRTVLPVPGLPSEKPGSVQKPPGELPGTSVAPGSGSASVSPSDIPGPSGSPTGPATRGGGSTAPVPVPVSPSAPADGTAPPASPGTTGPASPGTGPPPSGSPSASPSPRPTPSATPSANGTSTGPATSGSTPGGAPTGEPTGEPTGGEAAPGDGSPSATSSASAGT